MTTSESKAIVVEDVGVGAEAQHPKVIALRRAAARELGHREETVGDHLLAVIPDDAHAALKEVHGNPSGIVVQHVNAQGANYNRLVVSESEFQGIKDGEAKRAFLIKVHQKIVDDGLVIQYTGTHDGNDYVVTGANPHDPLTLTLWWVDDSGDVAEGYLEDVFKEPEA